MKKFFISHSHENKALANVIVSLLKDYYRIDINNITCTSDRNDITVGKEVKHYIWDRLRNTDVFLFLLTPEYWQSKYCVMELGAAWGLKINRIIPIHVGPLQDDPLNGTPLVDTQVLSLTDDTVQQFPMNLYYSLIDLKEIKRLPAGSEMKMDTTAISNQLSAYINQTISNSIWENLVYKAYSGDPIHATIDYKVKDAAIEIVTSFSNPDEQHQSGGSMFVSLALLFFEHIDLSCDRIKKDNFLQFTVKSEDHSVGCVKLEIKSGNEKFKWFDTKYCLNDETTYISVDLSKFPSQYLRDICEIDFVLWPSDLKKNTGRWQVCVEKLGVARNTSC